MEDADFALALMLQSQENDAESMKATFDHSRKPESSFNSVVDSSWELTDPNPDIRALFLQFNDQFFWGKLAGIEVKWSPRMTLCAGLCHYEGRHGLCSVRLSEPLLKLRPRKDLVETLLHEMIHAYLFVTNNDKDHDAHGPEFLKHMHRINKATGSNISVYHNFHDEVDEYRQHWWRCNGPCRSRPPYFGYVKRAMNRAPSVRDFWWPEHLATCGGVYTKIKEPENYGKKGTKIVKNEKPRKNEKQPASTNNSMDIRWYMSDSKVEDEKSSVTLHDQTVDVDLGSKTAGKHVSSTKKPSETLVSSRNSHIGKPSISHLVVRSATEPGNFTQVSAPSDLDAIKNLAGVVGCVNVKDLQDQIIKSANSSVASKEKNSLNNIVPMPKSTSDITDPGRPHTDFSDAKVQEKAETSALSKFPGKGYVLGHGSGNVQTGHKRVQAGDLNSSRETKVPKVLQSLVKRSLGSIDISSSGLSTKTSEGYKGDKDIFVESIQRQILSRPQVLSQNLQQCPMCKTNIEESEMNSHLDLCLVW